MDSDDDEVISNEEVARYHKIQQEMKNGEFVRFDEAFPDGIFAIPRERMDPRVKVRALWDYCKRYNKMPNELSDEEMALFLEWDDGK